MPPRPSSIITRSQKDELRGLLTLVQWDAPHAPAGTPYRLFSKLGRSMLFVGAGLRTLRLLTLGLARPALTSGGPLPEVVESLIVEFVRNAENDQVETALVWLESQLSAAAQTWTFVESIDAHIPQRIQLGSCTVVSDLAELDMDAAMFDAFDLTGPFIAATVEGRGQATARLVAIERIAEAMALLALLSAPAEVPDDEHIWKRHDGQFGYSTGEGGALAVHRVDRTGKLWPGYHELSGALARPEEERTEWEQRVIGAARWWRKASTTSWPSEIITAGMSALECLLLKAGERMEKANLLADRATTVAVLTTMTPSAQVGWLRCVYNRRNYALHAGRFHQDDLDAMDFLALVDLVVHEAIGHLDPWHRGTNDGPCTTIDEALSAHDEDDEGSTRT